MTVEEIRNDLFSRQDVTYRAFQCKLIPTVDPEAVIGVRTPELRKYAKRLIKDGGAAFLKDLPHRYFEENQLHSFIISDIKDYERCLEEVSRFLPYVNNWATCDQMSPGTFKNHRRELIGAVKLWLKSEEPYTVRFGIGMLMTHFLDEDFDPAYPQMAAGIRSKEYYVNMMVAWYFATALAKRYEEILPYIEGRRLDGWTHRQTIRKALESYRVTPEQKKYLKTLK